MIHGTLRYTLADGRVAVVAEAIPADLITVDGKYVAVPESGATVEIQGGSSEP